MSPLARKEYVRHMQGRYRRAQSRMEKSRLITEVSENLSCHRKHAHRRLNGKIVDLDKPWRRREQGASPLAVLKYPGGGQSLSPSDFQSPSEQTEPQPEGERPSPSPHFSAGTAWHRRPGGGLPLRGFSGRLGTELVADAPRGAGRAWEFPLQLSLLLRRKSPSDRP